ncbi:MAG: NUDIX hydrolase [Candidatus Pacebacteria bacterium]|nr:NUDIX hydrolase [Candidatus Paceibacterota bacterium]MBP9851457.1 NUDIX hydrolase [Candidatus Paceibacterota bacterium]
MKANPCDNGLCRDGAFGIFYVGSLERFRDIEVFLGKREDGFFELLGGGFDLTDLTPEKAISRELLEEASLHVEGMTYFCHMAQKLPFLGTGEKGHVFYFAKQVEKDWAKNAVPSHEHTELAWHKLSDIFEAGDSLYKTSTLRILMHFLHFLSDSKFRFGILGEKLGFNEYLF